MWQAFVQQSVCTIAEEYGIDAEFDDGLLPFAIMLAKLPFWAEIKNLRNSGQPNCKRYKSVNSSHIDIILHDSDS